MFCVAQLGAGALVACPAPRLRASTVSARSFNDVIPLDSITAVTLEEDVGIEYVDVLTNDPKSHVAREKMCAPSRPPAHLRFAARAPCARGPARPG